MKIILRTDIENLGSLGDVVEVKPGFGRNYLLPQGFAMLASAANVKVFELERKKLQEKANALRGVATSLATKIANVDVVIPMRVGDSGKLYGAVTTTMIADVLAEKGIEINRRRILLDSPLRVVGSYTVRIRLHADVVADLILNVVPERSAHEEEQFQAAAAQQRKQGQEVNGDEQPASVEEATA